MAIIIDGERSKNRIWFAKRLLEQARQLRLPSKSILLEGFLVRVSDLGKGLETLSVRAPVGAAICLSQTGSVSLFTADSLHLGFVAPGGLRISNYTLAQTGFWTSSNAEHPSVTMAPSELYDTDPIIGQLPTYRPPEPVLMPFANEMIVFSNFGIFNGTNTHHEARAGFFQSSGEGRRVSAGLCLLGVTGNRRDWGGVYHLPGPGMRLGYCKYGQMPIVSGQDKYQAFRIVQIDNQIAGLDITGDIMFGAVPASIRTYVTKPSYDTGTQEVSQARCLGGYVFQSTDGRFSVLGLYRLNLYFAEQNGVTITDAEERWQYFFTLYTVGDNTIYSWNAYQIAGAMEPVINPTSDVDKELIWSSGPDTGKPRYDRIEFYFLQLLAGNKVHGLLASDTASFHYNGRVYTWTRAWGAWRFSPSSGLASVSLAIPSEVTSTKGIRPIITGNENGHFLCDCKRVCQAAEDDEEPIATVALYVGSPFGSWTSLPMPDGILRHFRPVNVDEDFVTALGIVEIGAMHRLAMLRYSRGDSSGGWTIMGAIPATILDPDVAQWSVTLFGNDPDVQALARYATQPVALQQVYYKPFYDSEV